MKPVILGATLLIPASAAVVPGAATATTRFWSKAAGRLARSPWAAPLIAAFVSIAANALVWAIAGTPVPTVHDEFGYLLAADTFANGRLTNPPHPFWEHFETFHVIQQPTYAAKYPPGQGLVLAAGQHFCGHPYVGVLAATAAACGLVGWMLQAWLPPRWALFGGALVALHPLMAIWAGSYWGGAVAVAGGALVAGAVPRIVQRPGLRTGVPLGVGLVVLANSRPFEGAVLGVSAVTAMAAWAIRRRPPRVRLLTAGGAAAGVLACGAAATAYYNHRVTGSATTMPYVVHEREYGAAPLFVFQGPVPIPAYRHKIIEDFHIGFDLGTYQRLRTPSGFAVECVDRIAVLARMFMQPIGIWVAALSLPALIRSRPPARFATGACGTLVVAMLATTWMFTHYAAPAMGLFVYLVVDGLRVLWVRRGRLRPAVRALVVALPLLSLLSVARVAAERAAAPAGTMGVRAEIESSLRREGGRHLILVSYPRDRPATGEWVFNRADLEADPVVWARSMSAERDEALVRHYAGRSAWVLDASAANPTLARYK
ncbi:MAG TPA: hypothetical protein VF796_01215 [Humisphaera sp.]